MNIFLRIYIYIMIINVDCRVSILLSSLVVPKITIFIGSMFRLNAHHLPHSLHGVGWGGVAWSGVGMLTFPGPCAFDHAQSYKFIPSSSSRRQGKWQELIEMFTVLSHGWLKMALFLPPSLPHLALGVYPIDYS